MRLLVMIGLLVLTQVAHATCIVIVRTNKMITIGADSRRLITPPAGQYWKPFTVDTQCKIRKVGKYYFTLTGYNDSLQIKYAEDACLKAKSINDIEKLFADSLAENYKKALSPLRISNPDQYQSFIANREFGVVAFFTIESGVPELRTFYFNEKESTNTQLIIKRRIEKNCETTILGYRKYVDRLPEPLHTELFKLPKINPELFIRCVITYESNAVSFIVGGDIDILRLSRKLTKWIDLKSVCQSLSTSHL